MRLLGEPVGEKGGAEILGLWETLRARKLDAMKDDGLRPGKLYGTTVGRTEGVEDDDTAGHLLRSESRWMREVKQEVREVVQYGR